MNKRWDYHVQSFKLNMWGRLDLERIQAELKRLGTQGWELVSFQQSGPMTAPTAVFKREA